VIKKPLIVFNMCLVALMDYLVGILQEGVIGLQKSIEILISKSLINFIIILAIKVWSTLMVSRKNI